MLKGDKVNYTSSLTVDGVTTYTTVKGFTVDHVNTDGTVRILYPNGYTCGYAHITELTRV